MIYASAISKHLKPPKTLPDWRPIILSNNIPFNNCNIRHKHIFYDKFNCPPLDVWQQQNRCRCLLLRFTHSRFFNMRILHNMPPCPRIIYSWIDWDEVNAYRMIILESRILDTQVKSERSSSTIFGITSNNNNNNKNVIVPETLSDSFSIST